MIKQVLHAVVLILLASQVSAGPLHVAVRNGDVGMVEALINKKEDVNERDRNLGWPLHQAELNDNVEIAEILIEAGADVNVEHRVLGTPLLAASRRGSTSVARILLDHGANLNNRSGTVGETALHLAAASGNMDLVALLISVGADVNARTTRPRSERGDYAAIHSAGLEGNFDIVALLRDSGATAPSITPIEGLLATADVEAVSSILDARAKLQRVPHT